MKKRQVQNINLPSYAGEFSILSPFGGKLPQKINKSQEPPGKSEEAIHNSIVFSQDSLELSEHPSMLSDSQLILVFSV